MRPKGAIQPERKAAESPEEPAEEPSAGCCSRNQPAEPLQHSPRPDEEKGRDLLLQRPLLGL